MMAIRGIRDPIPAGTVLGRLGTGDGPPSAIPISTLLRGIQGGVTSAILDAAFGATQGNILYRSASAWTVLAPGTAGRLLQTGGAGANPSWATTGLTATITTAKLTALGTNGSMTFTNGILTASTPAT